MARTYQTDDWDRYRMDYGRPHEPLEPEETETAAVDGALADYLDHVRDPARFRASVNVVFDGEGLEVSAR